MLYEVILSYENIPYTLLKRIMQTCAQAGFTNISLAVEGQEPSLQPDVGDVNNVVAAQRDGL